MNFIVYGIVIWMALLVLKAMGFPLIKEFSWGQLFFVPVIVLLVRIGIVIVWFIVGFLALLCIYWFFGWCLENLDLPTSFHTTY